MCRFTKEEIVGVTTDQFRWKRGPLVIVLAVLLCVPAMGAVAQTDSAFGTQVVRQSAQMIDAEGTDIGVGEFWNTRNNFIVELVAGDGWLLTDVQVYAGSEMPQVKKDKMKPGDFPCDMEFDGRSSRGMIACALEDVLDLSWGGDQDRYIAVHGDLVKVDDEGTVTAENDFWLKPTASTDFANSVIDVTPIHSGFVFTMKFFHPRRGHFIDSPVGGLTYMTPTHTGVTDSSGAFDYFPGETVDLWVGTVYLGHASAGHKISPLDIFFVGSDVDPEDLAHTGPVVNMARLLQSLDVDGTPAGGIDITDTVKGCLDMAAEELLLFDPSTQMSLVDFEDSSLVQALIEGTHEQCAGAPGVALVEVSAADAAANLEAGLNASGIFRKNISKEPDFGATKIKLDIMPVYVPGLRSNGEPSYCDLNGTPDDLTDDIQGVPYEEWRLGGDPAEEACDPRDYEDANACQLTLIECREVSKPIVSAYMQQVDIFSANTNETFSSDRFAHDIFVSLSRDDGTTWKRTNVSRMGDLSSFDLETGESFPGTTRTPAMKVVDNNVVVAWTSTYCQSGNPRYAIDVCPDTDGDGIPDPTIDSNDDGIPDTCLIEKMEDAEPVFVEDYPYDNDYYVEDIWGVSGQQRSVDYDEVDDVADLGIGEIPYSCLWASRGTIVTQAELDNGTFASIDADDPDTPDVIEELELGEIVWFKPERLTSGRRDAFFPIVQGTRGAGFSIIWQEDPEGLRPGKGKGPGVGWSGAISNHQTDIWYSFIEIEDFQVVDENFVPGGPPDDGGPESTPGFGRPKALVPFSLPTPISDNNMINADTLKVELDGDGLPLVVDGTFVPLEEVFSGEGELIDGAGTTSYAYLAKDLPEYDYYEERGGTLDLCDTSGANAVITELPGTTAHERWYQFYNNAEEPALKTVCISSDGRLLDGDVGASRPNMSIQKDADGNAYVLLAYEESKGMGDGHETDGGEPVEKEPKPDYGKNLIYHSFAFNQPDLASPGHILNLPATCGPHQVYQLTDDEGNLVYKADGVTPELWCEEGAPIELNFPTVDADGNTLPGDVFQQYRTEVARRVRFIAQGETKVGDSGVVALTIFKQGLEGQGRPADVYIRRIVVGESDADNPFAFSNFECGVWMNEIGYPLYNNNVWGEPYGDPMCWSGGIAGTAADGSRGHYNLTSSMIDLAVDAGPDDDTPDDPTDDMYGTEKVLLWHQDATNIDDESFENYYSNSRSHRGFIRGDYVVIGFSYSPNWAAARNGRDRYNFYVRRSFSAGLDWTTTPPSEGGAGVLVCPEYRTDPDTPDDDGTGNALPAGVSAECMDIEWDSTKPFDEHMVPWLAMVDPATLIDPTVPVLLGAGAFEPARNVSMIMNNHETDLDPRIAATPPVTPLDGRYVKSVSGVDDEGNPYTYFVPAPAKLTIDHPEDKYVDSTYFVAWGTGDNATSTGGTTITPEATPLDLYYTRSSDWGDTYLMVPWNVNPQGSSSNWDQGEFVYRYDFLAHGDPDQGEAQLRSTADGSKMYAIYHEATGIEEDPNVELTRWYPWEPEETHDNDVWFRRVIFWPEG